MAVCSDSVHGLSSTLREDKGGSLTMSGGPVQPEAVTGMRLENELIQWASEMTVCADTMADIFPARQIASSQR